MLFRRLLNENKKGQALILSYTIVVVFVIISVSLFAKAVSEKNIAQRNRLTQEAFYLAEGATENAMASFASAIANYQVAADIANYNVNTTFSTFGNTVVNSQIRRLEDSDRLILEGATNVLVRNYEFVSTAMHPENNTIIVTLHQIVARRLIPAFQYMIFYNDDLEILPGPVMTLSGRIHSNKDIYVDSNSTLTIDSLYFRSAGDIFNQRKDSPTPSPGDVAIRVNKPGAPQYQNMNNLDSDSPNWTDEAINRWQGTVKSSVHGVTKLTAPSVASIQPAGYYRSWADVAISNGALTKNGIPLTEGVDYPVGTITTNTSAYNNREGKFIKMTNVDLKKLAGYVPNDPPGTPSFSNNLPANGLLYATRDDAGAGLEPGIRLLNGSEIHRNGGLTVVSNDPVYILGDYNTVNEKPTSVIGDSLNLLSNNWKDVNSTQVLGSRAAKETTVNCAFIAGIDTTTAGNYNGGLENYPRFHENWTGIRLNIKGSFVALWNSIIATGAWVYGSRQYTAPNRSWQYNTDFNNPAKLPPFTPWAVEMQRVAWWEE